MTRFIVIRHGQSMSNLEGYFTGQTNTPLSPTGRKQAELTADYILSTYKFDKVYASDLSRAYDTAKAVADRVGMEVIPHVGLREIYAGKWEGVSFKELNDTNCEAWQVWRSNVGKCRCPGGESVAEVRERTVKTFTEIAEANEGKTIVIGTHATVLRTLICHCMGIDADGMKTLSWVPNASVTVVEYDSGELRIAVPTYDKHLEGLQSSLPSNV